VQLNSIAVAICVSCRWGGTTDFKQTVMQGVEQYVNLSETMQQPYVDSLITVFRKHLPFDTTGEQEHCRPDLVKANYDSGSLASSSMAALMYLM